MKNISILIFVAIILGMGCKSSSDKLNYAEFSEDMMPVTRMDEAIPPPPPVRVSGASDFEADADADADADFISEQLLIKTANITIIVESYEVARFKIDSLVKLYKGIVSSESLYNYDYQITNNLEIRIPSEKLDNILSDLIAIAQKVEYQQIQSSDVTEDYIDISSRLKNQRAVERKFQSLLYRTDSIDEILKIESKLAEVRGQIESLEGRIKYLRNRVQLSSVYLNVTQKIEYKYTPEAMESFWERFKKSLDKGWKGLVSIVLFIIKLWPLWLIGGILTLIFFRIDRKKGDKLKPNKKKKQKGKEKSKSKKVDKQDTPILSE